MIWQAVLAAGLVLTALVILYNLRYQAIARERHPPEGEFLEVEGARVHYVRQGQGPTVVLLHGLNGFMQDFLGDVMDGLEGEFEVVALDRPGYGHSERPQIELSDPRVQALWLDRVLDALGIEHPILVGHSWGGALAMTFAQAHPGRVRALVLLAPYVYPGTEPDDWFHKLPRMRGMRNAI
ncbi:MAG: alpha/beta fold hydrolase, partial [Candidatus Thermoplasmatota archaeon]|nr:alpha/beta fold hydrolase [Candidatus Thermoplasmatota archaeon]